jgi:sterol desaturase/sphingolipid hydroxylase (fatty acid hydroxylase superfamily)
LRQAARAFVQHPNGWILGGAGLAAAGAKFAVGGWRMGDALLALVILALWPFQEWVFHVGILHWRPKTVLGRRVDLYAARKHRAHHRDPTVGALVFIPTIIVAASLAALPAAWLLLLPLPLGLTGLTVYYLLAFRYEWTHFLIHTTYRARTARFKRLWLNHRLHHFRNERYWYGVSMILADKALHTDPDPRATRVSPTCMTLGVESELSAASSLQ